MKSPAVLGALPPMPALTRGAPTANVRALQFYGKKHYLRKLSVCSVSRKVGSVKR
jgi:hypothetical protein